MTESFFKILSSLNTVYIDITDPDDAINAIRALLNGTVSYEYKLEDLKTRIDYGQTARARHEILERIINEAGSALTQCDAFELFVHADKWRSLRDLLEVDPWRTSFNYRGDYKANTTPLLYPDVCFTTPFLQYEPQAANEFEIDNLILFTNGVLRPRVKSLKFNTGLYPDFPTFY